MLKRLVFALLVACGGSGRVSEVSLALPHTVDSPHPPATLLGCTIVGTGERRGDGDEEYPFRVFDSNDAREPVFVIAHPERAHVTWSQFPVRAERGRARVGLGGQAHVRFDGFADLYGRTFTTTTRMDSVPAHLWAHAGSPLYVMSANQNGDIFAQVATPFRAPRTIVVQGNCASVIYETAPHFSGKDRTIALVSDAPSFRLFASPSSARAFTTLTPTDPVFFDVVERSGDFVHVTGDEGNIGFDAWVLSADTREFTSGGRVHGAHRASPPSVRFDGQHLAHVARDTPLYAGDPPLAVAGAWIEKGAYVGYDPSAATLADGRQVVPFDFDDLFIVAPEGSRLWIAKDVVSSAP